MKHFLFGSSTAARTDACPDWVKLSEGIPRQESSFALFGTTVHTMLEGRALDDDYRFESYLGHKIDGEVITRDHITMADAMWEATEEVLDRYGAAEWEAETTGVAGDDTGGTLDMIATCHDRALLIDYKTGYNQVSPEGNKQILFAAAVCEIESNAADMLADHNLFTGIIIQPDTAGNVQSKTWDFTRLEVDDFWTHHEKQITIARAGGTGMPVTGSHCAFCPAAATRCPAKNGDALRALQMEPADLERLAANMDLVEDLKKWCGEVEKTAYAQLEVGAKVVGWKLVAKRATEKWRDADLMVRKLRTKLGGKKNLLEEKPITPAAARRLMKERKVDIDLEPFTIKESSGTTLAPEADKRPEVLSAEAFKAALDSVAC